MGGQFQSLALQNADSDVQPLVSYSTWEEVRPKNECNACKCITAFCMAQMRKEPLGFRCQDMEDLTSSLLVIEQKAWGEGEVELHLRAALPVHFLVELEVVHLLGI